MAPCQAAGRRKRSRRPRRPHAPSRHACVSHGRPDRRRHAGPCTGRGLASRACDAAHSRPHQQAVSLRPSRACAVPGGTAADSQVAATTGGCGMGTTLGGCDAGEVRARPSAHLPSMNSCAPRGRRPLCPRKPEPARQTARRPRANEGRPASASRPRFPPLRAGALGTQRRPRRRASTSGWGNGYWSVERGCRCRLTSPTRSVRTRRSTKHQCPSRRSKRSKYRP